jgi:hypothetical protein
MEGIGRVAVAVSYAEFTVDMLGWSLTGKLEAYLTLTKRMSFGPKVDCVKDMSKSLVTDNGLRDGVKTFCENLKNIINKRNYAVHSLYGVDLGDIIRVNIRAIPERRRTVVTPSELFELSAEITKLAAEGASLRDEVENHRRKPAL